MFRGIHVRVGRRLHVQNKFDFPRQSNYYNHMTRSFILALLLGVSCQQHSGIITDMSFSRPLVPHVDGTLKAPEGEARATLLARVPDGAFANYAKDAELCRLLTRLDALAAELPDSSRRSAAELARDNDVRGGGPGQFYSEEEALAQEEQYLSWSPGQRLAYATQAMRALLARPAKADEIFEDYRLHSYDDLDAEALRGAIGGYVGRTLMGEESFRMKATKEQRLSRRNSELAYKRLMARLMLEDVASNRSLPLGTRCAALACLRHIYTERACHADGAHDYDYMISALPRKGAIPTLLGMGDMRFLHYFRFDAAKRVDALLKGAAPCAGQSPERLLDHASIAVREPLRDEATGTLILRCGPSAYMKEEDVLRAEKRYKALGHEKRAALAKEVMAALLTQPLTPCRNGMTGQTLPVRSYDALDVESIRRKAGGIFAEEHPHAALLFKRMVARVLLEEKLADHRVHDSLLRYAAVECLRHICLEAFAQADGCYPTLYMVDALPVNHNELEEALFGEQGAWGEGEQSN